MSGLSLDEITAAAGDDEPGTPLVAEIPPDLWARYCLAREKVAEWTDDLKAARGEIEQIMGDREDATVDGVKVLRWYWRKVNKFRQAKLKADHPDVVAAYTELDEERRFEVTG